MVAVATTPDGIFSMVTEKANTEISGPGDFNLLVDPKDLTAYLIYGLVIRLSQMNVKDFMMMKLTINIKDKIIL